MTNRDALVDALGDANVIMVLGGHYQAQLIEKFATPLPPNEREK